MLSSVDADAAQAWFIAGTIPLILAGGGHLVLALIDAVRPTYFAPIRETVKPAMEGSGVELVRMSGGRGAKPSTWSVWLGVHMTHGLGIFAFGLLCLLIATQDFELVETIDVIRPLAIAFSGSLLAISLRFFFRGPVLITGTSTACFIVATVLSA